MALLMLPSAAIAVVAGVIVIDVAVVAAVVSYRYGC